MGNRGRPPGSKSGGSKSPKRELPSTVEELNKATAGLKPFSRPVVRAYDALMQAISDEALDDEEKQMGYDTVAALMWYYGLTHPLVLALIFAGGTTARRAPAIRAKIQKRREAKQVGNSIPGAAPQTRLKPVPPPAPTPQLEAKPTPAV